MIDINEPEKLVDSAEYDVKLHTLPSGRYYNLQVSQGNDVSTFTDMSFPADALDAIIIALSAERDGRLLAQQTADGAAKWEQWERAARPGKRPLVVKKPDSLRAFFANTPKTRPIPQDSPTEYNKRRNDFMKGLRDKGWRSIGHGVYKHPDGGQFSMDKYLGGSLWSQYSEREIWPDTAGKY